MTDDIKPESLKVSLKSMKPTDKEFKFVLRLSNKADRALHYISDVRRTKYDPQTRTLTLCLSDEGREVIPGIMSKLPEFRFIDPNSDAEIELRLPNKIVKLSRSAPPGELAFETHQLSEAEKIEVEVAWADIPYYKDTRKLKEDGRLPAARWEQHKARAIKDIPGRKPKKSK